MTAAGGVLLVFGALAVWVGLFVYGVLRRSFAAFLVFGIPLMLFLNVRYLLEGATDGIAFFIGIYDVLINIGLAPGETREAVMPCPDNACTVWGERYQAHPAWGVAFYDRFANGPEMRSLLLYGHITGNSIALCRIGLSGRSPLIELIGRSLICCPISVSASMAWRSPSTASTIFKGKRISHAPN